MGRIGENERIKENMELASVLMLVKTLQPYSRKSSVGPLSHAESTGARLCFVTSTSRHPSHCDFLPAHHLYAQPLSTLYDLPLHNSVVNSDVHYTNFNVNSQDHL
jgi:hypothetical protein